MANGIGNAVGVRHTETNLIIWSAYAPEATPAKAVAAVPTTQNNVTFTPIFAADVRYDAGDQGCAFGPLDEIARVIRRMESGQTLEIHATDMTVAADLSAWCRMTGHILVEQQGSHYLVRRK